MKIYKATKKTPQPFPLQKKYSICYFSALTSQTHHIQRNLNFPQQVIIEDDDEFVIIGNRHLWEVLSIQEAVREARAEANPVLAAKRLQDLGQAYGAEENLSVIVVRLSTSSALPTPVQPLSRLLMRELRQAVHSKSIAQQQQEAGGVAGNGTCTCPCCMPRLASHDAPAACCCHAAAAHAGLSDAGAVGNGFYLNGVLRNVMSARYVCYIIIYMYILIFTIVAADMRWCFSFTGVFYGEEGMFVWSVGEVVAVDIDAPRELCRWARAREKVFVAAGAGVYRFWPKTNCFLMRCKR